MSVDIAVGTHDDRTLRHWNGIRVGVLGVAAAVAMVCALPSVAGAQVRVVNTTADHAPDGCDEAPVGDCTLREAVTQDTATEIELPDDTYPLTSQLSIARSLTIRGTQAGELATLVRGTADPMRIVQVQPDIAVQFFKLRVVGGETNGLGGGIFVTNAASLVMFDGEIVDNEAASGGGIWATGTLTLVRTTVASNDAVGDNEGDAGRGGGVGLAPGVPATMVNTTLSGNTTTGQGGGLYTQRSSVLQNVSIVGNEAPPRGPENIGKGGGLLQSFPSGSGLRTTATNVLVARNVNGGCGGTAGEFFIDSDNGLVDEPLPNTTCNAQGDNNLIVPDALVETLAFNGGLTRTHALLGDSPAVDAGASCPPDDQRGVPRPFGPACDIGAFELDTIADVNVFTDDSNGACTPAHCTLRERVDAAVDDDVINLDAGTYVLSEGELRLDESVAVIGQGARSTTIDANRTSRIGFVTGSDVLISGVTITGGDADASGNEVTGWGGAFYVEATGGLSVGQSALTDNVASLVGGAVANQGAFFLVESLAYNNRVQGSNNPVLGGAIWSIGQGAFLFNSTVSGNSVISTNQSATRGGGIYAADASNLFHVTITGNSAEEGAGLYDASGDSSIIGTLIAGNQGPECGDASISTTVEHHNLSDDTTCQFDAEGDLQGVDPLLAPLANYGGPTDTHALRAGSPAIDGQDAQLCPSVDQRFFIRPPGPCDIGAFEGSLAPPAPPPGSGGGNTQQPPPPQDEEQELPPPVAGKTVNAEPAGGTVKVKLKGTNRFVELEEGQQIPVGSEIDTRKGRVTLEAAGGSKATFYDGLFRFGQGKGAKPLTTLTLIEKLSCPKRGKASIAAKKKKRKLWGDGSGKFRTEGEFSSATVRGTRWLTEDSCNSTLTRVAKGSVSVRDFVKKKTVVVKAGKQYVAKRKR